MTDTILFIDGQNFLNKIHDIIEHQKKGPFEQLKIDYPKLFDSALNGIKVSSKKFYSAKIRQHKDTEKKSKELIENQRKLKTKLEREGFEFIIAGNVRGNYETDLRTGKQTLVFKEKGVDVAMAVEAVTLACDKKIRSAIICSSDSDLQPAVNQLKQRKVEVIYLGFERNPNKGLVYTSDKAILIRDSEIIKCYRTEKEIKK